MRQRLFAAVSFLILAACAAEEDLSQMLGSVARGTAWFAGQLDHYEELRSPVGA